MEGLNIILDRRPLGKFYVRTKTEPVFYTAIDNETGEAWTDDFKTLSSCYRYLEGKKQKTKVANGLIAKD